MSVIIGVDPSQRHTGLVALSTVVGSTPRFSEIQPKDSILASGLQIKAEFIAWVRLMKVTFPGEDLIFSIEKQLPVGGQTSALQFYIQLCVLEGIGQFINTEKRQEVVMPLPVQLRSYMRKRHNVDITSASSGVASFKDQYKNEPWMVGLTRISQHKVDAFYLAKLAEDVMAGYWKYKLPSRDLRVVPWGILNE